MYLMKLWLKKFLNLKKEIDIQVQEAQKVPDMINPKRPTVSYIILKWQKLENFKGNKRKQTVTSKERSTN